MNDAQIKERIKQAIQSGRIRFLHQPAKSLQRQARKLNTQGAWDSLFNEQSVAEFIDVTARIIMHEDHVFQTLEDLIKQYRPDDKKLFTRLNKAKQKGLLALLENGRRIKLDLNSHEGNFYDEKKNKVSIQGPPAHTLYFSPKTAQASAFSRSRVVTHEMLHYFQHAIFGFSLKTHNKLTKDERELFAITATNLIEDGNSIPRTIYEAIFESRNGNAKPAHGDINKMFNRVAKIDGAMTEEQFEISRAIRRDSFLELLKTSVDHYILDIDMTQNLISYFLEYNQLTTLKDTGISPMEKRFLENCLDISKLNGVIPKGISIEFSNPLQNGNFATARVKGY